jgi:protein AaeX
MMMPTTLPVDVDLFGFFAPVLLLVLAGCVIFYIFLDLLLARLGVYRFAWHPGLFRVALFIALFCGTSLFFYRY